MSFAMKVARWTLAVAIIVAALASCSRLPMAPYERVVKNPTFVHGPLPTSSAQAGPGGLLSGSDSNGVSGSAVIDGAAGGQFNVGRFTLIVPPGAFAGTATLSITVPDTAVIYCELGIEPPTLNHFSVPVTLRSDCSGTNADLASRLVQLWYDESAGVWRPVPGSAPDVVNFDVIAPLQHFSIYGIIEDVLGVVEGKAGW